MSRIDCEAAPNGQEKTSMLIASHRQQEIDESKKILDVGILVHAITVFGETEDLETGNSRLGMRVRRVIYLHEEKKFLLLEIHHHQVRERTGRWILYRNPPGMFGPSEFIGYADEKVAASSECYAEPETDLAGYIFRIVWKTDNQKQMTRTERKAIKWFRERYHSVG